MDFAAGKIAICIASRKKLNLQQLQRKKSSSVVVRIKVDFAEVAKEKTEYSW